ncbi:hypothetical protein BpHYR1_019671 [Brachionus plicatilis]|uniref:Uncharacterized protein n=1 Tax=Brachionus plicatilis TaxID=10195 RepID=A0A3M7RNX7_BRAPC|nr:hypothetical protein BpHYR1_019671 [Brachionus plicatilis]
MENSKGYSTGKYGGSIRQSGGAFGAREHLNEEIYFRKQDEIKFEQMREKIKTQKQKEEKNESDQAKH